MFLARHPQQIGDDVSATTTTSRPLGEPLWFLHNLSRILVDGEESENRFSLIDMTGAPGVRDHGILPTVDHENSPGR
jgi:hypothetical protein